MAKRIMSNSMTKTRAMLDELPAGSVVLDSYGHAWQSARGYGALGSSYATGYWYRAYGDSSEVSTWDMSFRGPFTVIHKGQP